MKNTIVAIFVLAVLAVSACTLPSQAPATGHTPTPQTPATGDIPALIRALEDEDPDMRVAAANALGEIGPEAMEAVPALVWAALEDEDRDVRSVAVWALGGIEPEVAISVLSRVLEDGDPDQVRTSAILGLRQSKGEAVPALIRALEDKDPDMRIAAVEVLGWIGPEVAEAVPVLIRVLEDDADPRVRESAAYELGYMGSEAVPALTRALEDEDPGVRSAAAEALEQIEQ
jgi:HEAT repeat protein